MSDDAGSYSVKTLGGGLRYGRRTSGGGGGLTYEKKIMYFLMRPGTIRARCARTIQTVCFLFGIDGEEFLEKTQLT